MEAQHETGFAGFGSFDLLCEANFVPGAPKPFTSALARIVHQVR